MSILKSLGAASVGLGLYLSVAPGVGSWALAVARKTAGQDIPCEWNRLLRFPRDMEKFTSGKAELAKQLTVAQRDEALGIVQIKGPGRSYWIKEKGMYVDGLELIALLLSERDFNFSALPAARVRQNDVVLDVGAHVGTFADFALQSGASKVILVEPDPVNLECLRRNFAPEIAAGKVVLVPEGAWSSERTIELSVGVANSGTGSMVNRETGAKTVTVPVRPIDRMIADLKIPRVDYIKMDIEGAEKEALKGAQVTLQRDMPRLHLDANHQPDDATALPALVAGLKPGYSVTTGNCECSQETKGRFVPHTLYFDHQ